MRYLVTSLLFLIVCLLLAFRLHGQNAVLANQTNSIAAPSYFADCTESYGRQTPSKDIAKSNLKSNGTSMGAIQANTNPALPNSYNFQEYIYAEPNDQGTCNGALNASANIEEVFFAQTHRHAVDHPFFFMIGERPALLQVAVTGTGTSPDVTVQGTMNGNNIGTLCLKGPASLPALLSFDINTPDFNNYFTVTLPKSWIQDGLSLTINAGGMSRTITSSELKIGPYTELNLVMVNQDVMDYNSGPHLKPIFDDFLEELASSMPASVVRFGIFPETIVYPEIVTSDGTETLIRFQGKGQVASHPIADDGYINAIAVEALGNMHLGTKDYVSTFYFGNTLNLAPGGWGGNKAFVSFDYTDVFIHELGHALSLPHWGNHYELTNPHPSTYEYPFGGETGNGGGRGTTWNFIQDSYEFVSPKCQDSNDPDNGNERSDCMQRNHPCLESRPSGLGPWDGQGQFSAYAMHRYLIGGSLESGQIMNRGAMRDYQLNAQLGFPRMTLSGGQRIYTRLSQQAQATRWEEAFQVPGQELLNTDVYLIYGTAHPEVQNQPVGNVVYKPIKFNGTLPPIVDPTDPATFAQFSQQPYDQYLGSTKDITIKVTFMDGSFQHVLNPYHSYARQPYTDNLSVFRYDMCHFAIVIPAVKEIQKVEVFDRPFCVRGTNDNTPGNIRYAPHNITAANFMNDATKLSEYLTGSLPGGVGPNAIGNLVWHDYDRDGIHEPNEPGISDVLLAFWGDQDLDGIVQQSFLGSTQTNANGNYRFGVGPGEYKAFVWLVDNWDVGGPLHGFMATNGHQAIADNDVDGDNNGTGAPFSDIISGIVVITPDGEPLNDGDPIDPWFDLDPSGNMTVDFGFYNPGLFVWIGEVDTDWQVDENWAGGIVPNPNSNVIIPSNRANYPVVDENIQIQKIEVQDGACIEVLLGFSFDVLCP